jgi:hypothetical protein
MMQKGLDISSISDLQNFLQAQVNSSKKTQHTPSLPGQKVLKPG